MIISHLVVDYFNTNCYVSVMIQRTITPNLLDALKDSPVVLLNGARQVGKSTLVEWLSSHGHTARYVTLDDAVVLSAVHNNPEGFLAGYQEPLIIDEVQRAPEIFLALKASIDKKRRAGQFLLTGSANVLLIPKLSESLAGRMEILSLYPCSQSEIEETKGSFAEDIFAEKIPRYSVKNINRPPLNERMIKGGYFEALQRNDPARRNSWFSSYVTTILQRDIRDLTHIEGLTALPRLLALLASRSGALLNFAELSNSSNIPQTTLKRYMTLLETTFLVRLVTPWSKNLSKRLIKTPKLYLTDTGLMLYLLGADEQRLRSDGEIMGKAVESFVLNELLKLISWSKTKPQIYHFRTQAGQEIDFLLERRDGSIVCIEVKSSQKVDAASFKTMKMLEAEMKKKFLRGIVLYDGNEVVPFEKNLYAVPIQVLWA
jgi:predicted AAA+ superfamily ATPase